MAVYHSCVSWLCILAMYHGYISWLCIMGPNMRIKAIVASEKPLWPLSQRESQTHCTEIICFLIFDSIWYRFKICKKNINILIYNALSAEKAEKCTLEASKVCMMWPKTWPTYCQKEPKHYQRVAKTCIKYDQRIAKTLLKYVQNIAKTWLAHGRHVAKILPTHC